MVRVLRLTGIAVLLYVTMRVEGQSQILYLSPVQVKSVSGVLQDEEGTPLRDATVEEFTPNWKKVLRTTATNSDGEFLFTTVKARKIYWLQVSPTGFNPLRMQLKLDRERGKSLKLKLKSIAQRAAERDAMLAAEPNRIVFAKPKMDCSEQTEFLSGDYDIVRRMRDLPEAIQRLYMMRDGSRSAIADPGEWFEVGDDLSDLKTPRRRLRFAGVAKDRAFVYYEHGGFALTLEIDLLRLSSSGNAAGVWRGYAGLADDLVSLQNNLSICVNDCSDRSTARCPQWTTGVSV